MSVLNENIPPSVVTETYSSPSSSPNRKPSSESAKGSQDNPSELKTPPNQDNEDIDSQYDENEDLLSEVTSDTTFFDEEASQSRISFASSSSKEPISVSNPSSPRNARSSSKDVIKEAWSFTPYRAEGKVSVLGEWVAKTKSFRYAVVGPDWPCVVITYVFIIGPSVVVYIYLVENLIEEIFFLILFGLCIFGLTTVVFIDPGLVRKYHHARSRHWTYCDHCESFRPPQTVHCSTCQVCIAGYDHHCPWTGKCIGQGNIIYFKIFVISLSWLVIYVILLGILLGVDVTR